VQAAIAELRDGSAPPEKCALFHCFLYTAFPSLPLFSRQHVTTITPPPSPTPVNIRKNHHRYAGDSQVASVLGKLRKFQDVLRAAGGLRVGLDELVPRPDGGGGRTLQVRVCWGGGGFGGGSVHHNLPLCTHRTLQIAASLNAPR
jgi:hypothetical protein